MVASIFSTQQAGNRVWTPDRIRSKLRWWLDAEQPASLSLSGSLVNSWSDLSGNVAAVSQSTSGFKPAYNTSIVNGRPGVLFDGVDDFMSVATGAVPDIADGNFDVWAIVHQSTPSNVSVRLISRIGATTTSRIQMGRNAANALRLNVGNGSTETLLADVVSMGTFDLVRFRVRPTERALQTDLNAEVTATVTPELLNSLCYVGASNTTSLFWQGAINSILMISGATTEDNANLLEYFRTRVGL